MLHCARSKKNLSFEHHNEVIFIKKYIYFVTFFPELPQFGQMG